MVEKIYPIMETREDYLEELGELRVKYGYSSNSTHFLVQYLSEHSQRLHILAQLLGYHPRDWRRTWAVLHEAAKLAQTKVGRKGDLVFLKDSKNNEVNLIQEVDSLRRRAQKLGLIPEPDRPPPDKEELAEKKAEKALSKVRLKKKNREERSAALLRLVFERTSLMTINTNDVATALLLHPHSALRWMRDWGKRGWVELDIVLPGSKGISSCKIKREFKSIYFNDEKYELFYKKFSEIYPEVEVETGIKDELPERRSPRELQYIEYKKHCDETGITVFTAPMLAEFFGTSRQTARVKIKHWVREGKATRGQGNKAPILYSWKPEKTYGTGDED